MAYTADDLCTEVRRAGSLPTNAATGTTDADLLAHADSELRDTLVPLLLGVSEEYYQRAFDQPITAGLASYRINKRAAHSRISTVQWLNTDGTLLNLTRIEPKQVAEYSNNASSGRPWAYYLDGSRVVLFPTPTDATGTLRVRAMVRPGRMHAVISSEAQPTTSIGSSTVSGVACWQLNVSGGLVVSGGVDLDVIASTPSFEHLVLDTTPSQTGATWVSFPKTAFTTPPVTGDYFCLADISPLIQLPVELHPSLVELTVARVLRALGKKSEAADHANEAQRLVAIGIQALTPRVDSAERKVVGGPHWRKRGWARGWTR